MDQEKKKSLALYLLLAHPRKLRLDNETLHKELIRKSFWHVRTKDMILVLSFFIGRRFYNITDKRSLLPAFGYGFFFFIGNSIIYSWSYLYCFSKAYDEVATQYQDEILNSDPELLRMINEYNKKDSPMHSGNGLGKPQRGWEPNLSLQGMKNEKVTPMSPYGQYREQPEGQDNFSYFSERKDPSKFDEPNRELDDKRMLDGEDRNRFQPYDNSYLSEWEFRARNSWGAQDYSGVNAEEEQAKANVRPVKKSTFVNYRFTPES